MLIKECQDLHNEGEIAEEIVLFLHARGCSKVQSIMILVNGLCLEPSLAKEMVHHSPAWASVQKRDEDFHEALYRCMEKVLDACFKRN